jgi:hypothetical protein
MTAPSRPVTAMTVAGAANWAAAPTATITVPWPRLMPAWAMPKAWARCSGGARRTKAALAATW